MAIGWGAFSTKSKKALKTGWLITAGVLAFYVGVIQPRERARGIASEKAAGLAAANVKDTLDVGGKLNEIRGAIEERQAEFEALSKQVETVAINITLRAEADAQVFGLHWRPLYQLKIAAREGLDGLADYAASMTAFVFYLPTVLLWLFTILAGAAVGWRIVRWAAKVLFGFPKVRAAFPAI